MLVLYNSNVRRSVFDWGFFVSFSGPLEMYNLDLYDHGATMLFVLE